MALLSDYTAGTVSSSGLVITGTGTAWKTAQFREGDEFIADGWRMLVQSVDSETQLTLRANSGVQGSALSGASYRLRYMSDGSRSSAQARQLIDLLGGSGNLEALAGLVGESGKVPVFTGAGTMGLTDPGTPDPNGNLEALAGLVSAPDVLAYFTDAGAAALADLTPFGRSILAGADAAAVRGILDVGADAIQGPESSTDGGLALWDGTGGDKLKDGPTIEEVQSWSLSSPQGRISLSSTDSVTQSDIATAINIHYVPCVGNRVPVLVGGSFVPRFMSAPITLALDDDSGHVGYHQSGKVFDVFAFDDAGSLMIGTGPAWASSASRGSGAGTTEIESYRGLLVNKNSISIRTGTNSGDVVAIPAREATYLGSFSPTADGQASDTKTKRLVFNAYNQARRAMFQSGAAASYTYSIAAWRIIGGASALRMSFLLGLDGVGVSATAVAMVMNSTATARVVRCGIGLDTENGFANGSLATSIQAVNALNSMIARYEGYPGAGLHYLAQIEMGAGADTQTWYATDGSNYQAGMVGDFLG